MFNPISIPFGCKMLFNELKLKPGVTLGQVEMALGEMCNVVKNNYGGAKGGFIAGQVFRFAGFASTQGSLGGGGATDDTALDHVVIVTYWNSFAEHETSHADQAFKQKFDALAGLCTESRELGYEMLWQGEPE